MNMQVFYKRLSVKSSRAHQRRLTNMTRVSRSQILEATNELTWLLWNEEVAPNV